MSTPNLAIVHIAASQNQKEVTANTAFNNLDTALTNLISIAMADADFTVAGADALGNMVFIFTGALTADRNVIVPTNKKLYIVKNGTTGGKTITVKTALGTGIALAAAMGFTALYCDGTNVLQVASAAVLLATNLNSGVNNQTGVSYVFVSGDKGSLVTFSNAGAVAITLPQAGASFPAGWFVDVENRGAGTATITPTTSTIDGAASLVLLQNQGVRIVSDGTNYFTQRGMDRVSSVFGRIGAVVAAAGDYDASLITTGLFDPARMATAIDARTTVTEAVVDSDRGKLVTFNNASAVAASIAQAGGGGLFAAGWWAWLENRGAGLVTLTPTTSTVNGATTLAIPRYSATLLVSDGTNYLALFFPGGGISGSGFAVLQTSPNIYDPFIETLPSAARVLRFRNRDQIRYRSDIALDSVGSGINWNIFDDTGGVYLPFLVTASKVQIDLNNAGGSFSHSFGANADRYARLDGLRIAGSDEANTIYSNARNIGIGVDAGKEVVVGNGGVGRFPTYTVAGLPAAPTAGAIAYASNGRKVGEGAGAGTGVPVYFSNGAWRTYSNDAAVTS